MVKRGQFDIMSILLQKKKKKTTKTPPWKITSNYTTWAEIEILRFPSTKLKTEIIY